MKQSLLILLLTLGANFAGASVYVVDSVYCSNDHVYPVIYNNSKRGGFIRIDGRTFKAVEKLTDSDRDVLEFRVETGPEPEDTLQCAIRSFREFKY